MNKYKTKTSDSRFFTNSETDSLYARFVSTLNHAQFFDILVGYFRTSGFYRLYKDLEKVEEIRLLVGLNLDKAAVDLFSEAVSQKSFDFVPHVKCKKIYKEALREEFEEEDDSPEVEEAAKKFIEFIKSGKLKIKVHPSRNIHAKVYITRFDEGFMDFGRVVTGSSNFSEAGLVAQREFNVELKDKPDVEFALERFNELWEEGVEVTDSYVDTVKKQTWLNDQITPYEIYLKFLYEYFREDINVDEEADFSFPDGFLDLKYQKQAVLSGKKILETYGGVFLSDVVGLGKTFITALLLQQLPVGRKLIICPPVLKDYWRETLHDFYVPGFDVESAGKLDQILAKGVEKYLYIVVDEAHRFRNELTQSYETLHKICRGKKVILVTATPLNNKLEDIKSQIKLFQPLKKSDIPGVPNLEVFFNALQKQLNQFEKGTPEYFQAVKETSRKVRDRVLKHIMVRRTRSEIKDYFSTDLKQQGLSFPHIGPPQKIVYEFDGPTEKVFNQTIALLKQFSYSRYTPILFLKKEVSEFYQQSQRNVGGFMKGILVKRLESSFYAFRMSLNRFVDSYEKFLGMYDNGTVWISKKANVYDLLDADDEETLSKLLEEDQAEKYEASEFTESFKEKLVQDLNILREIKKLWKPIKNDPKLSFFVKELKENPDLKGKRIIVFSESKETIDYLQENLKAVFPGKVLSYSSQGGKIDNDFFKGLTVREKIEANYNPDFKKPENEIDTLLTTDVLAEGINLHRANIIINYDLPWNPTRVLQRVGRVNRVGTAHKEIFIFNFFPTTHSDSHLGLEANIVGKIQAFHDTLGEDAKYLSDEEEVTSHQLFGETLYKKLTSKETYQDEEDVESELKFLKVIRDVRNNNPDLFETIKTLPKKARTARRIPENSKIEPDQLLTFFRKGMLKKFIISYGKESAEIDFMMAAKNFECTPDEKREGIPKTFYNLLSANKNFLIELSQEEHFTAGKVGGSSNEAYLIKILKSSSVTKFKGFTEDDELYLRGVRDALEAGSIPKNTSKKAAQAIKRKPEPLNILHILKKHVSEVDLSFEEKTQNQRSVQEVILSEFFIRSDDE